MIIFAIHQQFSCPQVLRLFKPPSLLYVKSTCSAYGQAPGGLGFLAYQGKLHSTWGPITEPDTFLTFLYWSTMYHTADTTKARLRARKAWTAV